MVVNVTNASFLRCHIGAFHFSTYCLLGVSFHFFVSTYLRFCLPIYIIFCGCMQMLGKVFVYALQLEL